MVLKDELMLNGSYDVAFTYAIMSVESSPFVVYDIYIINNRLQVKSNDNTLECNNNE